MAILLNGNPFVTTRRFFQTRLGPILRLKRAQTNEQQQDNSIHIRNDRG